MTSEAILNKVIQIVADVAECDPSAVTAATSLPDDLGIDSLMGLEVVVGIERQFKISLADQEVGDMRTPASIVQMVLPFFQAQSALAVA